MTRAQALQANVSIFDVFDVLGIQHHGIGTYQVHCPNPLHEDDNPSARVYANTNSVFCWTCNKTWDVVELVRVYKECSFVEACDFLEAKFGRVKYNRDPNWVAKLQARKSRGFVTEKEVKCVARIVEDAFVVYFKTNIRQYAQVWVWNFYYYWLEEVFNELKNDRRFKNVEIIELYKSWHEFGVKCLWCLYNARHSDIPSWLTVSATAYSRSACKRYDIPFAQDARANNRQRVQAFRAITRLANEVREHSARVAANS